MEMCGGPIRNKGSCDVANVVCGKEFMSMRIKGVCKNLFIRDASKDIQHYSDICVHFIVLKTYFVDVKLFYYKFIAMQTL